MPTSQIASRATHGLAILTATFALAAIPAFSGTPKPEGPYRGPGRYEIENVASGKVLESGADGGSVQQWPRARRRSQQWDIEDAGSGYVYVKSAENGMAMDVEGGRDRDGARVILSPVAARESQLWKIEHESEGRVRIVSRLGKVLDLPNGSRGDGVEYQIFHSASEHNVDNQRFRLVWISPLVRDNPQPPGPGNTLTDERGAYDLGYSLGVEDFRARLRRTYVRHKGKYPQQWEEAFIEGYYDGYDAGRTDTSTMQSAEKDSYDEGYRRGQQDYRDGRRPDYARYAGRLDRRFEPFFRRGYEDGYYSTR